jgi:signal transduction histidine kinase
MKRVGLRAKFILVLSTLLLILFAGGMTALVRQSDASLRSDLNQKSRSFATLATKPIADDYKLFKDSGLIRISQQVNRYLSLDSDIYQISIVDVDGRTVYDSSKEAPVKVSAETASTFTPLYIYNSQHEVTRVVQPYIEANGAHQYSLVYQVSNKRVTDARHKAVVGIAVFGMLALVLSIALSYTLINKLFLKPVSEVSGLALRISQGNLGTQIIVNRQDEIGDMGRAVNTMADSLKADIVKLQEVDKLKSEFMMITSHNLRTPLTIINGYLETLKDLDLSTETNKIIDTIAANAVRLGAFAEDVLAISLIESGEFVLPTKQMALRPLLEQVGKDFSMLAPQKPLKFSASIKLLDEQADISASHIRSALWNLLDNAYKFTAAGGTIKLIAKVDKDQAFITITDSGIGISPAEKSKLFTKFHRGTSTEQYDYEGTGIGLYLTKLIVDKHHGNISVDTIEGQGSSFTISLPLVNTKTSPESPTA